MPDPLAQRLVTELRALGLSDTDIGRTIELNSSAVAQIAGTSARTGNPLASQRGAGYGKAAAPALQALRDQLAGATSSGQAKATARVVAASGSAAAARTRRTVKTPSGSVRPARVRQSTRAVGKTASGALLSGAGAGKGKAFDRLLAKAARAGDDVSIRVNMRMGDGSTQWMTLAARDAEFWIGLRDGWDEEDGDLADWLGMVCDDLFAEGDLTSEPGDVVGYAVQVAA